MSIELYVEPRAVYTWEQFKREKPPYSIALDGFVCAPTQRDPIGPYANFDHHSGVDRLATRSTSDQVYLEINLDLFDTFHDNGSPRAHVFVNHCDEDTCLAYWLLKNYTRCVNHGLPSINRLVYCEDRLDTTAGAYPLRSFPIRRQLAWIFELYTRARFEGRVAQMGADEMKEVINAVCARIDQHIKGEGSEINLEGHIEILKECPGFSLVKETGPAARMELHDKGIKAFVVLVAKKTDGSFVYTIGRRSVWVPFDNLNIYETLNVAESGIVNGGNRWGGGNITGGSPQKTGSFLSPDRVFEIVKGALNK